MNKVDLLASIDALCDMTASYKRGFVPKYRRVPMQDDPDAEVLREMFLTACEMLEDIPDEAEVPLAAIQPLFDGAHARIPYMAEDEDQGAWLTQHVVDWEQNVRSTYGE